MPSKKLLWLLPVLLVIFLTACTPTQTEPVVESISIPTDTPTLNATSTQPQQPTATAMPETPTPTTSSNEQEIPSAEQEELYKEWFVPYTSTVLLFETCNMMIETHINFHENEIDLAEARTELLAESNTIELVNRQIVTEVPSEATAPFLWELDTDMQELIAIWENMNSSDDLGGLALSDPLFSACTPFWENISTIAYAAMDAGVSEDALREMDAEIQDIINELWHSVLE